MWLARILAGALMHQRLLCKSHWGHGGQHEAAFCGHAPLQWRAFPNHALRSSKPDLPPLLFWHIRSTPTLSSYLADGPRPWLLNFHGVKIADQDFPSSCDHCHPRAGCGCPESWQSHLASSAPPPRSADLVDFLVQRSYLSLEQVSPSLFAARHPSGLNGRPLCMALHPLGMTLVCWVRLGLLALCFAALEAPNVRVHGVRSTLSTLTRASAS